MKGLLKRLQGPGVWQWLAVIIAGASLLLWRLGSLLPLSSIEAHLPTVKATLSQIWQSPTMLPLELSRLVVAAIAPTDGQTVSRLPSALLALCLIVFTYWLLVRWYSQRLALWGALLIASSSWLLHVGRLATGDILFPLATVAVMVLSSLWHQKQPPRWLPYLTAVVVGLLIYVPGAGWLLLVVLINEWGPIKRGFRALGGHIWWAITVLAVILAPLFNAFINNWHLGRLVLGLPANVPSPLSFGRHYLGVWEHIFVHGYNDPHYNLVGLMIINMVVTALFLVGLYLFGSHPKASRSRLLIGLGLVGSVLAALHGPVNIAILLPLVGILAVGGIGYLLNTWLKVFPRNPLARGFGVGLVVLVLALSATYELRSYFVAWPHAPETRAVFTEQP